MNRFRKDRHRRDANHHAIAKRLQELGCSVRDTSQCGDNGPDLQIGILGRDYGVEIKDVGKGLTLEQCDWHTAWRGQRPVVMWTEDQATAWVQKIRESLFDDAD